MSKESPDHHDAELVFRAYEMRREATMRESRHALNSQFWPKNFEDVLAITRPDHPMNTAFRQVGTYWEMVYGMAKHGIVHADYFLESNAEGFFLYAKVAPYLEEFRTKVSPVAFQHAEWAATQTATGRRVFAMFQSRVAQLLATK